jgi:hypothetical protein
LVSATLGLVTGAETGVAVGRNDGLSIGAEDFRKLAGVKVSSLEISSSTHKISSSSLLTSTDVGFSVSTFLDGDVGDLFGLVSGELAGFDAGESVGTPIGGFASVGVFLGAKLSSGTLSIAS